MAAVALTVVAVLSAGPAAAEQSDTVSTTRTASALATPGPANAPEYWFDRWRIGQLWASGADGRGVTIGEIDTGVDAALPELRGRVLRGKDFGAGGDGRVDREVSTFGHGTAMASIMVARPGLLDITGLAPGAKILPVAVPLNGTTDGSRPDQLPEAIRWATDHGAEIINMSVGGKQYPSDGSPCPPAEQRAVYHALAEGVVIVAAVGNTGPSDNTVEDPASCLGVVAVGAVDEAGQVASFSSRQLYLSLVAPGVNVPSLGREAGDAFAGDGTSQAAALVSASLALAASAMPGVRGRQLVTRLLNTLDDATSTPGSAYGYGQLDAYALVTAEVGADAANPVYSAVQPFYRRAAALAQVTVPTPHPATTVAARPSARTESRSRPGLDPMIRTGGLLVLAGLFGLLFLTGSARLRERRGRTDAAELSAAELSA